MSGRPFVVHVAQLRRVQGTRWRVVRRGTIEDMACSGSAVPEGAEAEVDVTLESVGGAVSVAGFVEAPWTGECRRCLSPASGTVHVQMLEHYTEEGDGSDTYPLTGDELDLGSMIHDTVVLELPQAPLCSAGCRGLCATCGVNLNQESCSCGPVPADPRWAPLGALRLREDSGGEEAAGH